MLLNIIMEWIQMHKRFKRVLFIRTKRNMLHCCMLYFVLINKVFGSCFRSLEVILVSDFSF